MVDSWADLHDYHPVSEEMQAEMGRVIEEEEWDNDVYEFFLNMNEYQKENMFDLLNEEKEQKMNNEQKFNDLYKNFVLKTKVQEFTDHFYDFNSKFKVYKDRLYSHWGDEHAKQLIDFLDEMKVIGFTEKEVTDFIIKEYLEKEVSDE